MTTQLASNPYYDDFDSAKDFHQILFKPGYAVQARELTQIQSILRDQISKFGNHMFKHGSVVLPGNSVADLNVCYVKLQPSLHDVLSTVGTVIYGGTSGLRALVKKSAAANSNETSVLYVSYYNSGVNGESVFLDGELLTTEDGSMSFTTSAIGACGGASIASIGRGVFFVNGSFVGVEPQSIVIGKYTSTPSCSVLLKITETIIDSDKDQSLLDPAQGSYNYAAPGADRLQISLTLSVLDLDAVIGDNYIELMRYDSGVLLEHLRYPKYNELEKNLARRTHDESGDYVVSGLTTSIREHLKVDLNGGRYSLPTGDSSKLIYTVDAGKAYIKGFECEVFTPRELTVSKARGVDHLKTTTANLTPSYGQFLYVTNPVGLPNFLQHEQVVLVNASAGVTNIGTARVTAIDYLESNTTESNAIFKLFVSDIVLTGGNDVSDIGKLTFAGGSLVVLNKLSVISNNSINFVLGELITSGIRQATVHKYTRSTGDLYVYKNSSTNDVPFIGDNVSAVSGAAGRVNMSEVLGRNVNDNLLIALPTNSTYRVKNSTNATDMSYKIYYETTVAISGGTGSFSVSGMTIDPKELGNFIIISSTGVHSYLLATVAADGLSVSFAGLGTVTSIRVICAATKTNANASPKSKTLVLSYSESGLIPANTIQLSKADGVRVKSIISTTDGNVTDQFYLDNGQRDYAYERASVLLIGGKTLPTGTLTVVYDYFNHNAGSGDYFSIDSYELSGLSDYYESEILVYKSKNTGNIFDLHDVLDFRPQVGDDGTYTSGSASLNRMVQIDSRISTSIQQYVGRIDSVVLNKGGTVGVVSGTPSETPREPTIDQDSLHLSSIVVPAYTFNSTDVKATLKNNRGFTMRDIGKIETRVSKLEEFVLLSETENSAVNYDIVDATTGLSRFKSGYLIDTFDNPDIIGDIYNSNFKVAYLSGNIIPQFEVIETPLIVKSNLGRSTGDVITLPYTEVIFAQQPLSSQITNINPFSVFSWNGTMVIVPSRDTWTEIENLPAIINNQTETRTEIINVRRPWNWVDPSGARATFAPVQQSFGGGKIICVELYKQGYLDKKTYELDEEFGELLKKSDPVALNGYHMWAQPVVNTMKKSKAFTKVVWFFASPWTKAMAQEMGYGEGSRVGRVMMKYGIKFCHLVGKYIK